MLIYQRVKEKRNYILYVHKTHDKSPQNLSDFEPTLAINPHWSPKRHKSQWLEL